MTSCYGKDGDFFKNTLALRDFPRNDAEILTPAYAILPMAAKRRTAALSLTALPVRQLAGRAFLVLLVTAAAASMVSSRHPGASSSGVRTQLLNAAAPLASVLSAPVQTLRDAGQWIQEIASVRAENRHLKTTAAQLSHWQAAAKMLETENSSLRALLHMVPTENASYITARIVSDSGSPYVHSALISAGEENGVKKDEAVIGGEGLIGRVIETGATSARVLLLTDINSRVPVMGEISRERSILVGNNAAPLTLAYVAPDSTLQVGERVVTSGDGGIFPAGIPVAVVTSVDAGHIQAVPLADFEKAEYVSVVQYTF